METWIRVSDSTTSLPIETQHKFASSHVRAYQVWMDGKRSYELVDSLKVEFLYAMCSAGLYVIFEHLADRGSEWIHSDLLRKLRSHEALVTDVRLKRAGIRRTGLSSWKTVPLFEIQGATNRREILEFLIKRSAIPTFELQWAISDSIIPLPDSTLRRLNLGEVGDDLLLRALEFYHGIASIDDSEGVLIATSRISREAVISAGRAAGERIGIPLTSDDAPQTNR